MRLKTSIFLWIFPAAVVPLTLLTLGASVWSERRYLEEVDHEVFASLDSLTAGIERRLLVERDVVTGLSGVPAVQRFAAVLNELADGRPGSGWQPRLDQVNRFIEAFQSVRTSLATVRLLDHDGNTRVKVRSGRRVPATYGGIGQLYTVEPEADDPLFERMLGGLPADAVGSLLLPDGPPAPPLYSTALALTQNAAVIGYLAIDPPLASLDRMLAIAPRPRGGELLIAELDSAEPGRDGRLLYDDAGGIRLSGGHADAAQLQTRYPGVYDATLIGSGGVIDAPDGGTRVYFRSLFPYPDRLVSWVIAYRIETAQLRTPFYRLRVGILVSVFVTLLLSLGLARIGAQRIGGPILRLAHALFRFAGGDREQRVAAAGPAEIRTAGRAFNDMATALTAAERERDQALAAEYRNRRLTSLGQMAGGIAHEISNPINTILSLTTLIEQELPEHAEQSRRDLRSIREEGERAAETIRSMMNVSTNVGGERVRFDAADWVRDSLALARKECRPCAVAPAIHVDLAQGLSIEGDPALLQRALRNLVENAVQASPAGACIEVRLTAAGGDALVEVLDRGPGLDIEQREHAFDPFYTTKAEGQGSGLGLSIALGIVQPHGGTLVLDNRPGGGTLARIVLPISGTPPDRDTEPTQEPP